MATDCMLDVPLPHFLRPPPVHFNWFIGVNVFREMHIRFASQELTFLDDDVTVDHARVGALTQAKP